jgi:hypothetical protein
MRKPAPLKPKSAAPEAIANRSSAAFLGAASSDFISREKRIL